MEKAGRWARLTAGCGVQRCAMGLAHGGWRLGLIEHFCECVVLVRGCQGRVE